MENVQVNGQKIWGPPKDWIGLPPSHGTEIYIKNLPDDVFEFELFRIFATIGRIYEVRLPVHWNGINRGYAFVRYTKISDADAAIEKFDGFEIRNGRKIKIMRSVDNKRLFLSCVPNFKTSDEIKNDLDEIVENVEKVYVYPTLENPSVYRGYAFVEFKSHRDAAIAKRTLTPDVCYDLFETQCIAVWANPLPFLHENVLKTINILFMRNIPMTLNGITIKRAIKNLLQDNTIQKVKRINNFAFLTFKDHESAKTALDVIKCHPDFLGSEGIQIEWAVPKELTDWNGNDSKGRLKTNKFNASAKNSNCLRTTSIGASFRRESDSTKEIQNDCTNMTDFQKRSNSMRQFVSGYDNKIPGNFNDSRGPLGGHLDSLKFDPAGRYEDAASKMDSIGTSGSKSFTFPYAVGDLTPQPTWNLSPDTELD